MSVISFRHRVARAPRRVGSARLAAIVVVGALVLVNLAPRSSEPRGPADDATIDAFLDAQIGDAGHPGASIAIIRNGQLDRLHVIGAADASGRQVTTQTPFMIGSLSKSLTALAVMRLVDAGQLALDTPVSRYLSAFRAGTAGATITIRQLLDHTSGLPSSVLTLASPSTTLDGAVNAIASVAPASTPGTRFEYANANYIVLGGVIVAITGQPFPDAMATLVFQPLGMDHTTADFDTAVRLGLGDAHRIWFGIPIADSPIHRADFAPAAFVASTPTDLARPIEMLMAGGLHGRERFLSETGVTALTTGAAPPTPTGGRYAMGWIDQVRDGTRTVLHSGSTTDMAALQAFAPGTGTGIILLANAQSVPYELLGKIDAIGLRALDEMLGRPTRGTLERFYLVVDAAFLAILLIWSRGLVRLAGRVRRREAAAAHRPPYRIAAAAARGYLDVVVPAFIIMGAPAAFSAPWNALVRTDIGLVLLVVVVMRAADGTLRFAGWWRRRSTTAFTGVDHGAQGSSAHGTASSV